MAIGKDKILTISARDYCDMYEKSMLMYTAKGIHVCLRDHADHSSLVDRFAQEVPKKAEVVVDFIYSLSSSIESSYASGTALIPKYDKAIIKK